jgi:anthranilate synthase component 1
MRYTKISLQSIILKWSIYLCHSLDGKNNISEIEQLLQSRNIASYKFSKKAKAFQIWLTKSSNIMWPKNCFRRCIPIVYLVGLPKASKETSSMCTELHWSHSFFFWLILNIWFFTWSTNYCKDRKAEIHPIAFKEQVMMKRRNTSQRIIRR